MSRSDNSRVINDFEFQDGVQTIARFATATGKLRNKSRGHPEEAEKDDVPIDAKDSSPSSKRQCKDQSGYSVTVDLTVYQWTLNFHPNVSKRLIDLARTKSIGETSTMDPGPFVPRIAHPPAMRAPTVKRIAKSGGGPCTLGPVLHLKYQGDLGFFAAERRTILRIRINRGFWVSRLAWLCSPHASFS